jgi:hypothetical protein
MDSNYKMSQSDVHEFEIHDKPNGALRATIARLPDGTWSTNLSGEPAVQGGAAPTLENQKSPQAAFNAFVEWANGPADEGDAGNEGDAARTGAATEGDTQA